MQQLSNEFSRNADDILQRLFKEERQTLYVVVVDEIDVLSRDVLFRLFSWATKESSLILIGIANIVNAEEHLFKSGLSPAELPFAPYDTNQLRNILVQKLGHQAQKFNPEALEMCARKVASKSGDIRSALAICEKALSISTNKPRVNLIDIMSCFSHSNLSKLIEGMPAQCKFALVATCIASNVALMGPESIPLSTRIFK